ncbi:hypothetical protein [Lentiprolixibacter aurantiacus]|uniref:DUF1772 domain-containing protein n=1 Tax=Lentiprolixibacter aurantiacus TaxID=2993939 RepID=A0AAE3MMX1_9FLAO|nr:hypothetical protein [Lentiprolixibacter aurantiacus]MCX2719797.1 hypothetical protein [Lentiprolixibacter aurantiacus]
METPLLGLLADAGLCVLAWMVQLIVYPGFLEYNPSDLISWHRKYTPRITVIVAPLMLVQLGIAIYHIIREPFGYNLISFILILAIWLFTFAYFVPIHQKIDAGKAKQADLRRLVNLSWSRTLPWTLVFLINLINYRVL